MHFSPEKYLKKFVNTTADIFTERHLLKAVSFDNKSIEYIVGIIVEDIAANRRFRRVECLKVLKRIIKNRSSDEAYSKELLENLFYLYRHFILVGSEEVQWAVSTYIKDHILNDECIKWLIDNYQESEHIANRLLRYPVRNERVSNWARNVLKSGELRDRISEIIGILIEEEVPSFVQEDNTTIMWAIYYSKCSKTQKRKLILEHLDYENYLPAIVVANRLEIGEISKDLLQHYRGLLVRRDDIV